MKVTKIYAPVSPPPLESVTLTLTLGEAESLRRIGGKCHVMGSSIHIDYSKEFSTHQTFLEKDRAVLVALFFKFEAEGL